MASQNGIRGKGRTWFVSRHPGALEWARRQDLVIDRWAAHIDPDLVEAGDTIIGTLPVSLAAAVCRRGAHYLHLSIEMPEAWRGRELSAAELVAAGAQLKQFRVIENG